MKRVAGLVLSIACSAAFGAEEQPLEIAQRASAAYREARYGAAAELYDLVVRLLPRSIAAHIGAARALARSGATAQALDRLSAVVDFGVRFDPADPAWDSIRNEPLFRRLESRMRAVTTPLIRSSVAFRLEKDLIPENIAFDPGSGVFFVGSMYKAKIVRIAPGGAVSDFVPSRRDGLLSVLGMKVDARRRELWAAAGNFGERPPMQVPDPASRDKGALFAFDADSGKLLGVHWGPPPVQFNDLVLTQEGDVYATAGGHGIWRLRRGGAAVEQFLAREGAFFNGIAIAPDGKAIFAASHSEGVLKIDLSTKTASLLALPPGTTLGGIDGLYVHENSLVGIQNGTDPIRVIRAWLDPEWTRVTRFAVLEQEHPESDIPLTGTIVGDHLYYVARSQLRAFDGPKIWPPERLKESTILRLPLEIAASPAPDLAAERNALLEMHRAEIRAHVELDAAALAEDHGDDFVSVTRGKISRSSSDETRRFFESYFEGASYPQYEDAQPPIVRVSDDGSMGWIISRTRVRRVKDGKESSFVYAGMMAYEKRNGRWVRVANVSTFE